MPAIDMLQLDASIEKAAVEYVQQHKQWLPDDYYLESEGLTTDQQHLRVIVVNKEDEINPVPGGGKSIELHIDPSTYDVVKELGFQ